MQAAAMGRVPAGPRALTRRPEALHWRSMKRVTQPWADELLARVRGRRGPRCRKASSTRRPSSRRSPSAATTPRCRSTGTATARVAGKRISASDIICTSRRLLGNGGRPCVKHLRHRPLHALCLARGLSRCDALTSHPPRNWAMTGAVPEGLAARSRENILCAPVVSRAISSACVTGCIAIAMVIDDDETTARIARVGVSGWYSLATALTIARAHPPAWLQRARYARLPPRCARVVIADHRIDGTRRYGSREGFVMKCSAAISTSGWNSRGHWVSARSFSPPGGLEELGIVAP